MLKYGEWTDNQWFNFVCGLLVAGRLNVIDNHTIDILDNTRIGGSGLIGINIGNVKWDSETEKSRTVKVPVFAHDVDIEFNAFSVEIIYDSTAVSVSNVYGGDWGTWGTDITCSQSTGKINVIGQLADTKGPKADIILFYIDFDVSQSYSLNANIPLYTASLACPAEYEDDLETILHSKTTLMKYNDYKGSRELEFIYPEDNRDGSIVITGNKYMKGEIPNNQEVINDEDPPTGIFVGRVETRPGLIGVDPIAINVNEKDIAKELSYNKFSCDIELLDDKQLITMQDIVPREDWTITQTITTLSNKHTYIHVVGEANRVLTKGETTCALKYQVKNNINNLNVILQITNAKIYLNNVVVNDYGKDGLVYYGETNDVYAEGSMEAEGGVWSPQEGVAWMTYGGYSMPVYLHPGDNQEKFIIPFTPDNTKTNVVVESPGYLLIRPGFKIDYNNNGDKQGKIIPIPYIAMDKLRYNDIWDMYIQSAKSYDIDYIDKIQIGETWNMSINGIKSYDIDYIDKIQIGETWNMSLNGIQKYNIDCIDNLSLIEMLNTNKIALNINNKSLIDNLSLNDLSEIIKIELSNSNVPVSDAVGFNDIYEIELIKGE